MGDDYLRGAPGEPRVHHADGQAGAAPDGRQVVKQAAKTAGISETGQLATHTGRRSVVTTLFVDGGEALEDIARFVGHAKPATTAGYVKRLDRRPESVARRAAAVLDAQADADKTPAQGSESPADSGSNGGSYGPGSSDKEANDGER